MRNSWFADPQSSQIEENIVIPTSEKLRAARVVADKVGVLDGTTLTNPGEVRDTLAMLGLIDDESESL